MVVRRTRHVLAEMERVGVDYHRDPVTGRIDVMELAAWGVFRFHRRFLDECSTVRGEPDSVDHVVDTFLAVAERVAKYDPQHQAALHAGAGEAVAQ
jgi:hypothetical protein